MTSRGTANGFLPLLLFVIFLHPNSFPISATSVTVAVSMCELRGENTSFLRNNFKLHDFSRQYNQVIALLKSLLITWKSPNTTDMLDFIVFSNSAAANNEIRREVETWLPKNTAILNLTFRNAEYPDGKQ